MPSKCFKGESNCPHLGKKYTASMTTQHENVPLALRSDFCISCLRNLRSTTYTQLRNSVSLVWKRRLLVHFYHTLLLRDVGWNYFYTASPVSRLEISHDHSSLSDKEFLTIRCWIRLQFQRWRKPSSSSSFLFYFSPSPTSFSKPVACFFSRPLDSIPRRTHLTLRDLATRTSHERQKHLLYWTLWYLDWKTVPANRRIRFSLATDYATCFRWTTSGKRNRKRMVRGMNEFEGSRKRARGFSRGARRRSGEDCRPRAALRVPVGPDDWNYHFSWY